MISDIIYTRVSSYFQAKQGSSLAHQDQSLAAWSERNGGHVLATFTDKGVSGRSLAKRPQLQAALAALESGQRLIVSRLSRLGRNAKEVLQTAELIKERRATLVVTTLNVDTSNAMGKFFFTISAAYAEMESDALSEHVQEMVGHIRGQNRVWGGTPFGWKREGKQLVPDEHERAVWRKVKVLRERGYSDRSIAQLLEDKGLVNRQGSPYHSSAINKMRRVDFSQHPTLYTVPKFYRKATR